MASRGDNAAQSKGGQHGTAAGEGEPINEEQKAEFNSEFLDMIDRFMESMTEPQMEVLARHLGHDPAKKMSKREFMIWCRRNTVLGSRDISGLQEVVDQERFDNLQRVLQEYRENLDKPGVHLEFSGNGGFTRFKKALLSIPRAICNMFRDVYGTPVINIAEGSILFYLRILSPSKLKRLKHDSYSGKLVEAALSVIKSNVDAGIYETVRDLSIVCSIDDKYDSLMEQTPKGQFTLPRIQESEDSFFECSLCLDIFKEPKLLPCLHRYCRDCIQKVIDKGKKSTLDCPLCKTKCEIPEGEADGFKTDFLINSILDFRQLKKSFEKGEEQVCVSCAKKQKAEGYCFKCTDFLCEQCCQIHLTSKMFTEHQPHLLNLKNVEAKNLTLQKLASLTEDPRCHDHPKSIAQLCCGTCENQPVCLTCTYGDHKDHELHDVSKVAKAEREKLQSDIDDLNIHRDELYDLRQKVKNARETLKVNVATKRDTLIRQHRSQSYKIERKMKTNDVSLAQTKTDILDTYQNKCALVQKEYDEKIEKLKAECKAALEREKKLRDENQAQAQEKHGSIQSDLINKRAAIDGNLKSLQEFIDTSTLQNEERTEPIKAHSDHTINRLENFMATTSTILASNDDWTNAKCIPDMRSASKPLIADVKRRFPELESLSDFTGKDLPSVFGDVKVTVTERKESVVDIAGMKDNGWVVTNIAGCSDGRIGITGKASNEYSFIAIINMKGEILRQEKIEKVQGSKWNPYRRCDSLSENHIVTVCPSGEIGIYDVRDGSHTKKNISDITSGWSSDQLVCCITADPVNNTIYVGSISSKTGSDTISRHVLVFDDKLNYRHTVSLPEMIRGSLDIIAHDGDLLVCDYDGKKAHAVTVDGQEAKHVHEFIKPDHGGGDWQPYSVCTDSNDYIYMMWQANISDKWKNILTQYSQDGRRLLKTIPVGGRAYRLCTIVTDEGEKLMLAAMTTEKLTTYSLVT